MGTLFECIALKLYANGIITNYYMNWLDYPFVSFFWVGLIPLWRDTHFYICHRSMHPWFTTKIPDIGAWLYNNAHYLHHMSDNYTVWSGISMHPIEGFLYESACLVPCLFLHHPLIIFIIKVDCTYKAILGHDGYDFPGASNF